MICVGSRRGSNTFEGLGLERPPRRSPLLGFLRLIGKRELATGILIVINGQLGNQACPCAKVLSLFYT